MKRIIDIDKPTFDDIIAANSITGHLGRVDWCIRNSKPYEERPTGQRLIDADELINVILKDHKLDGINANWEVNRILVHIKDAPTVEQEYYITGAQWDQFMKEHRRRTGAYDKIKTIIDGWAVDDDEHELLEQIADIISEEAEDEVN